MSYTYTTKYFFMKVLQYEMPENGKALAIAAEPEVMYLTKDKLNIFPLRISGNYHKNFYLHN